MKPEMNLKLTYGLWGIVGGAGIAMIIGFNWGGWTTSSTTQKISEEAVLASRAAICAAQFMDAPDHELKVKEFEATSSFMRTGFVESQGWDKMPGQEKAAWDVSSRCVAGIEALLKTAQSASAAVNQTGQK
jgi:alpha/beta superfamily hydrolase